MTDAQAEKEAVQLRGGKHDGMVVIVPRRQFFINVVEEGNNHVWEYVRATEGMNLLDYATPAMVQMWEGE